MGREGVTRTWKGKVDEGGKPQYHELASSSRGGQVNICFGEWRQNPQVMAVVAT